MSPDGNSPTAPDVDRPDIPATGDDFADIVGFIDGIGTSRVTGWAWNRSDPDERLEVEIRLDNEAFATVTADRLRQDLAKAGIGDGAFGFEAPLPEQLGKEDRHRVSAIVRRPGRAGVIRLKNQAAASVEALALRPSDFTMLVDRLDQCVEDQRAGFRWLYHELHALDEFVRGEAPGGPTIDALAGGAPADFADEFCAIESRFAEIVETQAAMRATLDGISALQQSLNQRLEQIDVFNARLDSTLAGLRQPPAEPEAPAGQPGLKRLVIFLALLTFASLGTGIVALLR